MTEIRKRLFYQIKSIRKWRDTLYRNHKIAFQSDAYRPLGAHISQHALRRVPANGRGGVCLWSQGGGSAHVCVWGGVPASGQGGCSRGISQHALGQTTSPPREQNSWHALLKILPCPNFVAGGNNFTGKIAVQFQQIFPPGCFEWTGGLKMKRHMKKTGCII